MDDWKCPDGWRVKADDEIVEKGDAYSHDAYGFRREVPKDASLSVGWKVANSRREFLTEGGFVLSRLPAPTTPEPNDTCLIWLAGKVDKAAKRNPDKAEQLYRDWFAAKSRLADEMLGKIEALEA